MTLSKNMNLTTNKFAIILFLCLSGILFGNDIQSFSWPDDSYIKACEMLKANKNKEAVDFLNKIMVPPFPFGFEPTPPPYQSTNSLPKAEEEKEAACLFYNKYPKRFKIGFYYYELLGQAYLYSNKPAEAFSTFFMSENYMPRKYKNAAESNLVARHYCNLSKTCEKLNRYADAESYCNHALTLCSSNDEVYAEILITRAVLMEKIGNFELCLKIYKELYGKNLLKNGEDYAGYARLLFRTGKNKMGFDVLFDGLIATSINNLQIENDPVINTIIDRITLASNEEIYVFYETLGDMLGIINLKAGMEKSIAFIINERNLLTKIFDFLASEDDLKRIKEEIAVNR